LYSQTIKTIGIMKKEQFEILMNVLYSNSQLFIPQGQTIQELIDNAQKKA